MIIPPALFAVKPEDVEKLKTAEKIVSGEATIEEATRVHAEKEATTLQQPVTTEYGVVQPQPTPTRVAPPAPAPAPTPSVPAWRGEHREVVTAPTTVEELGTQVEEQLTTVQEAQTTLQTKEQELSELQAQYEAGEIPYAQYQRHYQTEYYPAYREYETKYIKARRTADEYGALGRLARYRQRVKREREMAERVTLVRAAHEPKVQDVKTSWGAMPVTSVPVAGMPTSPFPIPTDVTHTPMWDPHYEFAMKVARTDMPMIGAAAHYRSLLDIAVKLPSEEGIEVLRTGVIWPEDWKAKKEEAVWEAMPAGGESVAWFMRERAPSGELRFDPSAYSYPVAPAEPKRDLLSGMVGAMTAGGFGALVTQPTRRTEFAPVGEVAEKDIIEASEAAVNEYLAYGKTAWFQVKRAVGGVPIAGELATGYTRAAESVVAGVAGLAGRQLPQPVWHAGGLWEAPGGWEGVSVRGPTPLEFAGQMVFWIPFTRGVIKGAQKVPQIPGRTWAAGRGLVRTYWGGAQEAFTGFGRVSPAAGKFVGKVGGLKPVQLLAGREYAFERLQAGWWPGVAKGYVHSLSEGLIGEKVTEFMPPGGWVTYRRGGGLAPFTEPLTLGVAKYVPALGRTKWPQGISQLAVEPKPGEVLQPKYVLVTPARATEAVMKVIPKPFTIGGARDVLYTTVTRYSPMRGVVMVPRTEIGTATRILSLEKQAGGMLARVTVGKGKYGMETKLTKLYGVPEDVSRTSIGISEFTRKGGISRSIVRWTGPPREFMWEIEQFALPFAPPEPALGHVILPPAGFVRTPFKALGSAEWGKYYQEIGKTTGGTARLGARTQQLMYIPTKTTAAIETPRVFAATGTRGGVGGFLEVAQAVRKSEEAWQRRKMREALGVEAEEEVMFSPFIWHIPFQSPVQKLAFGVGLRPVSRQTQVQRLGMGVMLTPAQAQRQRLAQVSMLGAAVGLGSMGKQMSAQKTALAQMQKLAQVQDLALQQALQHPPTQPVYPPLLPLLLRPRKRKERVAIKHPRVSTRPYRYKWPVKWLIYAPRKRATAKRPRRKKAAIKFPTVKIPKMAVKRKKRKGRR